MKGTLILNAFVCIVTVLWPLYRLIECLQCFDWVAWRASGLQKTERWGAGMVICLERGADSHTAQLMPLPLTVSCFSKIQIGFTFLVPAYLDSPGKVPLNGCVCIQVDWYHQPAGPMCLLLWAHAETDGWTLYCFIDPASHTVWQCFFCDGTSRYGVPENLTTG